MLAAGAKSDAEVDLAGGWRDLVSDRLPAGAKEEAQHEGEHMCQDFI
jgi:hypothetical protein